MIEQHPEGDKKCKRAPYLWHIVNVSTIEFSNQVHTPVLN